MNEPQTEFDTPWKQVIERYFEDFIRFFFPQAHGEIDLTKRLYEQGYQREDVINLFAFIDWVMSLPLALEQEFQQELSQYEREKRMPYITSVERLATEKGIQQGLLTGIQQGLLKGIELGLRLKFGSEGLSLLPEISALQDVEQLEAILKGLETVNTMDELRQIYQPQTPH